MSIARTGKARQQGFGMIEVLIAVLVLSIGVLALAQLQMSGLRNANSAALRLEAVNLTHDMLERMRANRRDALDGLYDVAIGGDSAAGGRVQQDIEEWKAALATLLPDGDGSIATDGGEITITAQWTESWDADLAGEPAMVRLRSEP